MAGKPDGEYPINVYMKKKDVENPKMVLNMFPYTKPGNIEMENKAGVSKSLEQWYAEIIKYNNSVDEKLESLQKEVDYLRGIESCMKYTSNMVIFDSEFIQNQTLTTSSLDTDFRRVGYFNFDAEDINDRRFNWL